jgi:hypothetical protein
MSKATSKPAKRVRSEPSEKTPIQTGSLEAILAQPSRRDETRAPAGQAISGIVIGTLAGVSPTGTPVVDFPGSPAKKPVEAIVLKSVASADAGREVALSFIDGDPARPLILGFIHKQEADTAERNSQAVDVRLDGESVTLKADQQIVLQCGKASITLTRAGKIIIKGAYLSSRSTGVNRIKGGSVQIN